MAVIAGEREHAPKPKIEKTGKQGHPKNQLLIDIDAKLAEGKGPGFAFWAKKHNLKQMAQTVAYLQDHGLMNYAALSEMAAAASAEYHELSDEIKALEERMKENKLLEKHIANYARTRPVYEAYRKAGYSKKFLAAHEGDIALHKEAKRYFDSLGIKKLPSTKTLHIEYAKLAKKKEEVYAEFRKRREGIKELLAAKANVDRILGKEPRDERTSQREKKTDAR